MSFTAKGEFNKRFVSSRCTPVSDFTAANVGKVNLAKSIEGSLLGTPIVKFFCLS
jgi:hypothetical protein